MIVDNLAARLPWLRNFLKDAEVFRAPFNIYPQTSDIRQVRLDNLSTVGAPEESSALMRAAEQYTVTLVGLSPKNLVNAWQAEVCVLPGGECYRAVVIDPRTATSPEELRRLVYSISGESSARVNGSAEPLEGYLTSVSPEDLRSLAAGCDRAANTSVIHAMALIALQNCVNVLEVEMVPAQLSKYLYIEFRVGGIDGQEPTEHIAWPSGHFTQFTADKPLGERTGS